MSNTTLANRDSNSSRSKTDSEQSPFVRRYSDCCSADLPNRLPKVLPQPTQFRSPTITMAASKPLAWFVLSKK